MIVYGQRRCPLTAGTGHGKYHCTTFMDWFVPLTWVRCLVQRLWTKVKNIAFWSYAVGWNVEAWRNPGVFCCMFAVWCTSCLETLLNTGFVSRVLERYVANAVREHVDNNGYNNAFLSAYRPRVSCIDVSVVLSCLGQSCQLYRHVICIVMSVLVAFFLWNFENAELFPYFKARVALKRFITCRLAIRRYWLSQMTIKAKHWVTHSVDNYSISLSSIFESRYFLTQVLSSSHICL